MISGTIALAFTAGMIATFNPCGFSLLPAYIGAFVAGDQLEERADRRVVRAVSVAAAVSIGFVVVFATVGLIIDSLASEARRQLPWVTITIGALLVLAGGATVLGWKPSLGLRTPGFVTAATNTKGMVGYGVTYAIASLSCTIGPFLAVTGTALSRSRLEGLATYVAYALGMGTIILLLSVASALAHSAVARHLRRLARSAPRIGGGLMVIAGAYAIWYGRWELAVYDGRLGTDPIIDTAEDLRLWFVDTIEGIGALRLTVLLIVAVAAVIARSGWSHRPDTAVPSRAGGSDPSTSPSGGPSSGPHRTRRGAFDEQSTPTT